MCLPAFVQGLGRYLLKLWAGVCASKKEKRQKYYLVVARCSPDHPDVQK